MVNMTDAYDLVANGSLVQGVSMSYTIAWGDWFYTIIFLSYLGLVALRTQNWAATGVMALIGLIGIHELLPIQSHVLWYVCVAMSLGVTLYMFFGSPKTE